MKTILLISTLFVFTYCLKDSDLVNNLDFIADINKKANGLWEAAPNPIFANRTISHVKTLLGWTGKKESPTIVSYKNAKVPDSFDARTYWKNCASIGTVQDQARCGSCWAFGAVESITDRFCIWSNGSQNDQLSFEDMVCCDEYDDGCEGGSAEDAMSYAVDNGLVTSKCSPYTVPTCAPSEEPCLNFVPTPACKKSCGDGETWTKSKHFLKTYHGVSSDVTSIQTEIMQYGPVEACFSVYEDLLNYKSGVYKHVSGGYLGGHCLKVAGWGTLNNDPYWILINSWTTYWGYNGTILFIRGKNNCGIEDDIVAGEPRL